MDLVTGQRSNQLSYVPTFFSSTYAKSKNLLSIVAVYLFSRFHVSTEFNRIPR